MLFSERLNAPRLDDAVPLTRSHAKPRHEQRHGEDADLLAHAELRFEPRIRVRCHARATSHALTRHGEHEGHDPARVKSVLPMATLFLFVNSPLLPSRRIQWVSQIVRPFPPDREPILVRLVIFRSHDLVVTADIRPFACSILLPRILLLYVDKLLWTVGIASLGLRVSGEYIVDVGEGWVVGGSLLPAAMTISSQSRSLDSCFGAPFTPVPKTKTNV
jgi:hypothetical protein